MKLLNEVKNELVKFENENLINFEIIDNKLLFENDDNNFEIIINENEVEVNYICKNDDSINKFNYEINNKNYKVLKDKENFQNAAEILYRIDNSIINLIN